ncbi:metal ABC transporter solute-binding protein, Zn/Mn family [Bifidobacterium aemilianum]|nr:zinc ABC transporter substrate-binding protein [Bifidobacterium aemilianum]
MRRLTRHLAAGAALVLLLSCGACAAVDKTQPTDGPKSSQQQPSGPISVVASTNSWGSLAQQIGGKHVSVTSIMDSPTTSAHGYQPSQADQTSLSKAEVVVINGSGYDDWAGQGLAKGALTIRADELAQANQGGDPHLWFSAQARTAMADTLASSFSRIRPDWKDDFAGALKSWNTKEKALEDSMRTFASQQQGRTYAATESVADYLMQELGFTDKTPQSYSQLVKAGQPVTSEALGDFQMLMDSQELELLVVNSQETGDAANVISGKAGRHGIALVSVSEQMPGGINSLNQWISTLMKSIQDAAKQEPQTNGGPSNQGQQDPLAPSNQGQQDPLAPSGQPGPNPTDGSNQGQQDPGR